jgi:tetratricopeptide (TPR) repeat protein
MNKIVTAVIVLSLQGQSNRALALNPVSASGSDSSQAVNAPGQSDSGAEARNLNEVAAKMVEQGREEMKHWHYVPAVSKFTEAVDAADKILKSNPENLDAMKNKASALSNMSTMHRKMCRYSEAIARCKEAIAVWDEASRLSINNSECLTGKTHSINNLVRFEVCLAQYSAAKINVDEAMKIHQESLDKAPSSAAVQNCKAETLIEYGHLLTKLGQYKEAEAFFNQALDLSNTVLKQNPNDMGAAYNRQQACFELGQLQIVLSQFDSALSTFDKAIEYCRAINAATPGDNSILVNAANSIFQKAFVLTKLGSFMKSFATRDEAVQTCNLVLKSEPDNLDAIAQKTHILQSQGAFQLATQDRKGALKNAKLVLDISNRALKNAPECLGIIDDKGLALLLLGRIASLSKQNEEAEDYFRQSLVCSDEILRITPGGDYIFMHKAFMLDCLAQVQDRMAQLAAARNTREQALSVCAEGVRQTPANLDVLLSQAYEFQSRTYYDSVLSDKKEVRKWGDQALDAYNIILSRFPDCFQALKGKGTVLKNIAMAKLGSKEESMETLQKAVACFDQAIKICPKDATAYSARGGALKDLGVLQMKTSTPLAQTEATLNDAIASCKKAIELNPGDKIYCEKTIKAAHMLLKPEYPGFKMRLGQKMPAVFMPKDMKERIKMLKKQLEAEEEDKATDSSKPPEKPESK